MVADATKLLQAGKEPGKDGPLEPEKPALVVAFESFIQQHPDGRAVGMRPERRVCRHGRRAAANAPSWQLGSTATRDDI